MANSWFYKQLRARFILIGEGAVFAGTNSNTLIVTGLRMSAQVQASSMVASQMALKVWGMKREDMDAITIAWAIPGIIRDHLVILEAFTGDGWSMVFSGTIIEAQPEYRGSPDTFLSVLASVGYLQRIAGATAASYEETVDIGLIAADLADKMGFTFVNGGANAVLSGGVSLWGTLVDQLDQACRMAGCDYYLTGTPSAPTGAPPGAVTPQNSRGTLTITPRGRPVEGLESSVYLTPNTGMIGYPVFGREGLNVQALWQPAFGCGVPLTIEHSVMTYANGDWYPYSMVHLLDANLPNGLWQTNMSCNRRGV